MNNDDYSWTMDEHDKMIIVIKHNGHRIMSLFLGEAMESAGRKNIMKHVKECDRTPWLHKWHEEAMESTVEILKGNPQEIM